jgi:hypothetical protein
MTSGLSFTFRSSAYEGEFFINNSRFPCFIFVLLKDEDLIKEFGTDITIKTVGNNRFGKKDDYPGVTALRQALFDVIKTTLHLLGQR